MQLRGTPKWRAAGYMGIASLALSLSLSLSLSLLHVDPNSGSGSEVAAFYRAPPHSTALRTFCKGVRNASMVLL